MGSITWIQIASNSLKKTMCNEKVIIILVCNIFYLQSVLLRRAVANVQWTGYEIILDVDNEEYVDGSYNLQYKLSCLLHQNQTTRVISCYVRMGPMRLLISVVFEGERAKGPPTIYRVLLLLFFVLYLSSFNCSQIVSVWIYYIYIYTSRCMNI